MATVSGSTAPAPNIASPPAESEVDQPMEGGGRGVEGGTDGRGAGGGEGAAGVEKREIEDCVMEEGGDGVRVLGASPVTVFRIRLKQTHANLRHKMKVPELCRKFSAVAWCGKLNAIACASETCARIPSSNANHPFWIPIHILCPERPTECSVFNITADSPRDSVQFIEWSPRSCPRALLISNFHGRTTIWTQPSQGPPNVVRDGSFWACEHEWRQDFSVATKWLSGTPSYRWLPPTSNGPANMKPSLEENFLCQVPQTSGRWPHFLCVCSVFSSGSVQLHWSHWPPCQNGVPKWFSSSKGLLGAGPSGIMAADAIVTDAGALHVAGVPLVNPSTIVVWEVAPGPGNVLQAIPKVHASNTLSPPLNPPHWINIAPLAAYLFSWQAYLVSEEIQGKKPSEHELSEAVPLHCSPVSNFSAYVCPDVAAQSAATTTWGSGVTAVAFDPTHGGSVISVVIVEGQYMSPYDPEEGPSITGWRIQCWKSSLQPVVLHPIFGNPASSFSGQPPMQTVWVIEVDKSIPPTDDFKTSQLSPSIQGPSERYSSDSSMDKANRMSFDPYDLPSDVRMLAQIVYSARGGELAVAFLRGGVHLFSGATFTPVDSYQVSVGSTIAAPAFSSTSCCLASVWHDSSKDRTTLKIIRVLPPAIPAAQAKLNSATWERAIADRFWWSLLAEVDWWDAVGCTQSAAEDGIVSLNSVIAVLDADFHSLPSIQHRQQHGPNLDRIKCRLLEGTNAQDVRALVLDMQARLLLDMLGKGIESALVNPATLLPEPWLASSETLSAIDADKMVVESALVSCTQAYVDAVLDLASHFITRLRRYASFCRTLATHAVTSASTSSNRSMVGSPPQNAPSPAPSQGNQTGGANTAGSSQMQAWVQGAIAKISTVDGGSSSTPNPINGPSSFMPISINTGTFPGTPAVRLIGDCHFLHKLCQLLLFCLIFRRRQSRSIGNLQKLPDSSLQKNLGVGGGKVEESTVSSRPALGGATRVEDGQVGRPGQLPFGAKGIEESSVGRSFRIGSGNAGQGYTSEEVRVLFLILVDLCRRTSSLAHPLPTSQVGTSNVMIRLHYIDGNYTVLPEVVEASLGPHMQNMPRPRGADAAGLLLRELELHPPAEEWHRRNMFGGPWSGPDNFGHLDATPDLKSVSASGDSNYIFSGSSDNFLSAQNIWPRKRRMSERDAAFGMKTSVGLGSYVGVMGSRRDVVTALWKTGLEGAWYKCIRCLRQTSAFAQPGETNTPNDANEREAWWISRWTHACPMCGGSWVRVV